MNSEPRSLYPIPCGGRMFFFLPPLISRGFFFFKRCAKKFGCHTPARPGKKGKMAQQEHKDGVSLQAQQALFRQETSSSSSFEDPVIEKRRKQLADAFAKFDLAHTGILARFGERWSLCLCISIATFVARACPRHEFEIFFLPSCACKGTFSATRW